jgi:O-antigen/teichoic acid export membrane protein
MRRDGFLRHALIYGAAGMLLQAAGLVLLPLYTRCLTPAEYGLLEILGRTGEVLATCLLVGGLRQALVAFHEQSESETDRRGVAPAALVLLLVGAVVVGCAVLPFLGTLSGWLGVSDIRLTGLAVLAFLLDPFWLVPLTLLQAREESTAYLLATLGQFLVKVAISIFLVGVLGWGVAGVLAAMALTGGLFSAALLGREMSRGMACPPARQVRAMFRFALPFLPGGLCFFILNYGDRFFLQAWHGAEAVGAYALGYKLALAVGTLSIRPLQMVWGVRMYEAARRPDAAAVFGRTFSRITAAYLFIGLALCVFADEVVFLLGGSAYAPAAAIIAPIVLAGLLQTAACLMDAGLYIRRRTDRKAVLSLAATVVMLTAYAVLIPSWGGIGAALATVLGYGFLAACTWRASQGVFPVAYEWDRLSRACLLAVAVVATARLLPVSSWAVVAKAMLVAATPGLAWQLGLVSAAEKQYLRALWGDCVDRLALAVGRRARRPLGHDA